jgi:hypothetical protein
MSTSIVVILELLWGEKPAKEESLDLIIPVWREDGRLKAGLSEATVAY